MYTSFWSLMSLDFKFKSVQTLREESANQPKDRSQYEDVRNQIENEWKQGNFMLK